MLKTGNLFALFEEFGLTTYICVPLSEFSLDHVPFLRYNYGNDFHLQQHKQNLSTYVVSIKLLIQLLAVPMVLGFSERYEYCFFVFCL